MADFHKRFEIEIAFNRFMPSFARTGLKLKAILRL